MILLLYYPFYVCMYMFLVLSPCLKYLISDQALLSDFQVFFIMTQIFSSPSRYNPMPWLGKSYEGKCFSVHWWLKLAICHSSAWVGWWTVLFVVTSIRLSHHINLFSIPFLDNCLIKWLPGSTFILELWFWLTVLLYWTYFIYGRNVKCVVFFSSDF